MDDKTREEKPLGLWGFLGVMLYYLSFIPYLYLVYSAAMGVKGFFAFMDYKGTMYGLDAVLFSGMLLTLIPVLPVCLLYQILFGVLYIRVRPKKIRRLAAIYACVFAALLVIPCLVYWGRETVYSAKVESEIRTFLEDKYGKDLASDARIVLDSMEDEEFKVYSPVLPDDVFFTVRRDMDTHEFDDHNDLIRAWANNNEGFIEALNTYLDEKYGMPDGYHIHADCIALEFGDFKNGDDYSDLISNAEYSIYSIDMEPEIIDQESLESITFDVWESYVPKFGDSVDECLMVYIYDDNGTVAEIQILQASFEDNGIPVGYIDVYENMYDDPYEIEDEVFYLV